MSSYCKGLCSREISQLIIGYKNGQKYCKKCEKYIRTELLLCYCCKNKIRNKPKYNKKKTSKASTYIINETEEYDICQL